MQCEDKIRYSTGAAARRALSGIRRRAPKHEKKPVAYYPCKHCGGFHLTSNPR